MKKIFLGIIAAVFFLSEASIAQSNLLPGLSTQPVCAYSLRKLSNGFSGSAIQVRRSSDNTTQNIGFTAAGDLDTTALKTFVGSGNGFVSIWYDQSGNGINAAQTTSTNQPSIISAGVINRDNGKPSIYTSATGYLVYGSMSQFNGLYTATRMSVARSRNGSAGATIDGLSNYTLDCQLLSNNYAQFQINTGSIVVGGTVVNNNALMSINCMRNTGASKVYINGVQIGSSSSAVGAFGSAVNGYIGVRGDLGGQAGAFSETLLFNAVISDADRQLINNNQNSYYSLINPLDKIGAPSAKPVTAFSLRQLGSSYSGSAIQVRRSSDNATQNIGFTSAGDLDTTALKTFVGSGNGFVSIWYDQGGNGINATQTTASNQPSIVTAGVINRDNGKPAIYTSATGYLIYSGMSQFNGLYTATRMSVARSRNGSSGATIDGLSNYTLDCQLMSNNNARFQINSGNIVVSGAVQNNNALMAINCMRNNGDSKIYINGAQTGSSSSALGAFGSSVTGYIGVRGDLGGQAGAFSETILFSSVLSDADRLAIDNNQIGYYSLVNSLEKLGSPSAKPVTAFSLRQLGSGYYGKLIQVRRSSDNTTQDIGFTTAGDLDTTALKTFVGSGNGFVSIWYDQGGNGINAIQTTASKQPSIVTAGVINRDNGKPAIYTSANGYLIYSNMSQFNGLYTATRMSVARSRNGSEGATIDGLSNYALDCQLMSNNYAQFQINSGNIVVGGAVGNNNLLMSINCMRNNGDSKVYINGVQTGSSSSGVGAFGTSVNGYIGVRGDLGGQPGAVSETLLFNTVISEADRNVIDSSQIKYFTIANPIDKVGMLTASPVAAFSLRRLSTGYIGQAIQVRRSSDNAVQDIGFTTSGDLDTTALKSFVGSGNGYVSIWYDQSGQNKNKTQATTSLQPLIVNAGIIYRKGVKPVIYFPSTSGSGLVGASPDYLTAGDISVVLTAWSNSSTATYRRAIQGKTQNWLVGPYNNHNTWYAGGWIVDDASSPWQTSGEVITVVEPAAGNNTMYRAGIKVMNTSNVPKTLPGSLSVSAAGVYNEPMDGYISEILEFNAALTMNDRSAIEQSTGSYNAIKTWKNNLMNTWLPAVESVEAFSLRLLNTGYSGPLVRIKTGSNYYDVYPDDDGNLSMSSPISASYASYNAATTEATDNQLSTVITGGANATVAIWYDQSNRGWNAVQAVDANQPVLIQSGAFINAPGNTRPAMLFNQANKSFLQGVATDLNGANTFTVNSIFHQRTVNTQVLMGKDKVWNLVLGLNGVSGAGSFNSSQNGTSWTDKSVKFFGVGLPSLNKVNGITGVYKSSGQAVYGNGIPLGSLNTSIAALGNGGQAFQISGYGGATGSNYWDGYIQEIIITSIELGDEERRLLTTSQQSYYKTKSYNSWTGANSQSWTDNCNWSSGKMPVATDNVFIPSGTSNVPAISSAVGSPDSVIIAPGAVLNISSGGSFTGTAPKVVLLAASTGMGYLVNTSGASVGTVTMQKWIEPQQGFRALAYPFSAGQTNFLANASVANGLDIRLNSGTGTTSQSSGTPAIPTATISDAQYFSNNAWTNLVNGTTNANIPYALYCRGYSSAVDNLSGTYGPAPFAFTVSGAANSGSSVNIPAANSTTAFTVAGNPFTAPVTTLAMTGDASGNTSYYVWEVPVGSTVAAKNTDAGQWVPYLPTNRLLPVMSAMAFKQATASSSISVSTSAISTTGTLHTQVARQTTSRNKDQKETSLRYLELQLEEDGVYKDRLFVRLESGASDKSADKMDMEKLYNNSFNIYTLAADRMRLAVDVRKEVIQPIPVGIRMKNAGQYRFVVKNNDVVNGADLYLRDNLLQTETQLKTGVVYEFAVNNSMAAGNENRFEIFNKTISQNQVENRDFSAVLLPNVIERNEQARVMISNTDNSKVSVELFNAQGIKFATKYVERGVVDLNTASLASGIYFVKCKKKEETITLKLMIR